jgi:hypothetical protein
MEKGADIGSGRPAAIADTWKDFSGDFDALMAKAIKEVNSEAAGARKGAGLH